MGNPLDDVTQDRRDDSGNPLRRVYIDTSDAPVSQGTGAGNALVQATQAAQPAAEAVPWTIEDLQRGVEAIKQYVAGNVAPVNDMAKRFTNYDRQFTQDVLNAPATIWGNPTAADKVGQRFMGGENWLSNMVRSATTAPGKALASEVPVTSEEMVAPAQDIAGMATGSMLFGRPGAATLGAGPVRPAPMPDRYLVPAVKWNGKIYKGESGQGHGEVWPSELLQAAEKRGVHKADILDEFPGTDVGFVDHKGRFLNHDRAAKYAADNPEIVKDEFRDLIKDKPFFTTDMLLSDSQPGTAVSALAQSAKGPAPVFYSALEHAATNAAQDVMSPQQWLGFLKNTPGVKAEELAWTGLPEWLGAQKGKVSKKDVQSYLDEHKVEIKDVTKEGPQASDLVTDDLHESAMNAVIDAFNERNPHMVGQEHTQRYQTALERFGESRWGEEIYNGVLEGGFEPPGAVRYGTPDLVLPGGENYREHLLTMPANTSGNKLAKLNAEYKALSDEYLGKKELTPEKQQRWADVEEEIAKLRKADVDTNTGNYRSSHWDEPNVLAHVRTNDRTMTRELSPEHVAINEARAKVQQQIEAVKHEQAAVANEISAVVRPLEKARQDQIRADIKANRISGAEGLRKLEEYYEHPEIKPLQDKLERLRAKETELGYSVHDIVPRTMTDEQALAAAKDWVNEGNPNSKKWEQTPKVRQDAWLEQVQKVAGRKAMNEAEKPVKSLHIEEIQSDWHQQGRKQGYKNDDAGKAYDEYMSDLRERIKNDTLTIAKQHGISDERAQVLASESLRKMQPHEMARFFGEEPQMKALWDAKVAGDRGVPDAPFKTTWPELALKRMIRHAAEEGYDRISWTPGEAQAARYDLSKQIDKIYYNPDKNILIAYDKNSGRPAIEKHDIKPGQLADVIGKEAADKIINNPSSKEKGNHVLSNADLKVGGEGMREFYDKMLPKMAEKIGKSHGVKVKTAKLPGEDIKVVKGDDGHFYLEQNGRRTDDGAYMTREGAEKDAAERGGHVVHYFDLPQSLKEHAIGKGFPLYMSGVPFPLTPVDYDPFKKEKEKIRVIRRGANDQNTIRAEDAQAARVYGPTFNQEDH